MIGPPAPDEPPGGHDGQRDGGDLMSPRHARLVSLWVLVLERFRDYLRWTMDVTGDPRTEPGGTHDPDA
jgi:hypothetical protein